MEYLFYQLVLLICSSFYNVNSVPLCSPALFPKVIGDSTWNENTVIRGIEYSEKLDYLAAFGCTTSNAIRGYGGWNHYYSLIIVYEVSTMNIMWGKTWDRSMTDCFIGGIFSEMPD